MDREFVGELRLPSTEADGDDVLVFAVERRDDGSDVLTIDSKAESVQIFSFELGREEALKLCSLAASGVSLLLRPAPPQKFMVADLVHIRSRQPESGDLGFSGQRGEVASVVLEPGRWLYFVKLPSILEPLMFLEEQLVAADVRNLEGKAVGA